MNGIVSAYTFSLTNSTISTFYIADIGDFAFFVFERTKHQPRRNLRISYSVLQRLCNEAALSPGIDAFWY